MSHDPHAPGPWSPPPAVPAEAGAALLDPLGLPLTPAPVGPAGRPLREARGSPRFPPPRPMPCRITLLTSRQTTRARVLNLSQGGLSLLAEQAMEPGTCALAELSSSSGLFSRVLMLHVLYSAELPDRAFHLGGEFLAPLAPAELRLLLS
jgi:hypothetical protein